LALTGCLGEPGFPGWTKRLVPVHCEFDLDEPSVTLTVMGQRRQPEISIVFGVHNLPPHGVESGESQSY
jgi:hypothetical protein